VLNEPAKGATEITLPQGVRGSIRPFVIAVWKARIKRVVAVLTPRRGFKMSVRFVLLSLFVLGLCGSSIANPNKDLRRAVLEDDNEALLKAFDQGADIALRTFKDGSLVNLAATYKSLKALNTLLVVWQKHVPSDDKQESPLHVAVRFGELEAARFLLSRGADVNERGEYGWTPLHLACDNGLVDMAALLLAHGARTDIRNESGHEPLHLAATTLNSKLIHLLLKNGARANAVTHLGRTTVHYALAAGDEKSAQMLVDSGADPQVSDKHGYTAYGYARLVKKLMEEPVRHEDLPPYILALVSPRGQLTPSHN
jgi:ankyrin repeat protein